MGGAALSRVLPETLLGAIEAVAVYARPAVDPWWIIGSAAVALSGATDVDVADLDLLTSGRDAERILRAAGVDRDRQSDRSTFRSLYGCLPSPGLPIEIMGGLEVRVEDRWVAVAPETRIATRVRDAVVYIPERPELVAILACFGRPKDLARIALLQRTNADDRRSRLA